LTDDIHVNVVSHTILSMKEKPWVVDSGSTSHICANKNMFTSYKTIGKGKEHIILSDSRTVDVLGIGKVDLKLTSEKTISLSNVLYVPHMSYNLESVSILSKAGVTVTFESNKVLLSKCGGFVGKGFYSNGLFVLDISTIMNKNITSACLVDSYDIWHARLGHISSSYVFKLDRLGIISLGDKEHDKCDVCVECKLTKKTCPPMQRESNLLDLIHTDLGDLKQTPTRGGKYYYVTFIDDFSRYTKVYLLRHKDEAFNMFLSYKAEIENQLNKKIKRVRSDRGGEYISFNEFCEKEGIIHEITHPYSPESNGVAERKNRTLKEMMNSMLVSSHAPNNLWGEALLSACFFY